MFRRWLIRWLEKHNEKIHMTSASTRPMSISDVSTNAFQFTVHMAKGGRVIEVQRFDRKRDEYHRGLYVITEEQDFGNEVEKILTMESLK